MIEEQLRKEIDRARNFNSAGTFIVLSILGLLFWLYEYSDIDVPFWLSSVVLVLSLFLGPIAFHWANETANAKCPSCGKVVESGGFWQQPYPMACPSCGLKVPQI